MLDKVCLLFSLSGLFQYKCSTKQGSWPLKEMEQSDNADAFFPS